MHRELPRGLGGRRFQMRWLSRGLESRYHTTRRLLQNSRFEEATRALRIFRIALLFEKAAGKVCAPMENLGAITARKGFLHALAQPRASRLRLLQGKNKTSIAKGVEAIRAMIGLLSEPFPNRGCDALFDHSLGVTRAARSTLLCASIAMAAKDEEESSGGYLEAYLLAERIRQQVEVLESEDTDMTEAGDEPLSVAAGASRIAAVSRRVLQSVHVIVDEAHVPLIVAAACGGSRAVEHVIPSICNVDAFAKIPPALEPLPPKPFIFDLALTAYEKSLTGAPTASPTSIEEAGGIMSKLKSLWR
eukprot:Polyplicarium_translucidae@DN3105_c0_g1_i8.p1